MVVKLGEYSAYTSDRQNAFEWEILIFKNKTSIAVYIGKVNLLKPI